MFSFKMNLIDFLLDWTHRTFEPLGSLGLFLVSFMEASFFPVPPDLLLIALSLADPSNALLFASIVVIGSVLGAAFGYLIGRIGEKAILERFVSPKKIIKVHKLYSKYDFWAVVIGGFTPLPFKVFTVSAGVFFIDFRKFVLACFIGRSLRFFSEAVLLMFYGEAIVDFLRTNFNILTVLFTLFLLLVFFLYKMSKRSKLAVFE